MSRAPQTFKQRDLTKALKATVKAALPVGRVEIDRTGKIVIVPKDEANKAAPLDLNEWDKVLQ